MILAGSILTPAFDICATFFAGFADGLRQVEMMEQGKLKPEDALDVMATSPLDISFNPEISNIYFGSDSITFSNGEKYPIILNRAIVVVPAEKNDSPLSWLAVAIYISCSVLFVLLMIEFIKFIININRGEIFSDSNVVRLKRFAWYLISIALLNIAAGVIEDYIVAGMGLKLDGYYPTAYWMIPWANLLLGLVALLMSQIWSRGLEMKEEQELTI